MSLSRFAVAAMAMSVSVLALGAGAHDGGHGEGVNIGEPGSVSDANRTINVAMYDNYYEPESIEVKPGETVRFVIENKGSLVHEFNIGTASMHEAHQAEMMMMVEHGVIQGGKLNKEMAGMDHSMMDMDMDMGKGHSMKHDDPNSVLLEPGENKEIIWKFAEKGAIEFACNVPGHYQAGMYGDVNFN
ncbi:cupredoxin domain-containing protein [Halopseudomonas sp.]|uniref:cupredoxin domain-containing protein n=1 Tax=Halopseudomonas sp. TaxID=2901191 RepID=UPI003002C5BE